MKFILLPRAAKQALIQYFIIEGEDDSFDDLLDVVPTNDEQWDALIARADDIKGDEEYDFQNVDADDAKSFVWANTPDLAEEHDNFEAYHQFYVDGGDMPDHDNCKWPVIASPSCGEALIDGWHRFHYYLMCKCEQIPIINLDK